MKEKYSASKFGTTKWTHKMFDRSYEEDYAQAIVDYLDMAKKSPLTFMEKSEEVRKKGNWAENHFNCLPKILVADYLPDLPYDQVSVMAVGLAKIEMDKLYTQVKPNDIHKAEGNVWLTDGFTAILQLATGTGSPQAWNNATADLGVGNSATAAAKSDTGLLGGSTSFKAMDATYPTTASGGSFNVQGTWGTGDALFVWNEETFRNGGTALDYWNRSVTSLGDKSAVSQTWVLQGTISMT